MSKIQTIQNKALKYISKTYDNSVSRIESLRDKIKLLSVPNRLSDMNERYVRNALENGNPLIAGLVEEYKTGFRSRIEAGSTPLSNIAFEDLV